jgi:ABC-type glycerol-3-phosphate transport system substrate-binding protein
MILMVSVKWISLLTTSLLVACAPTPAAEDGITTELILTSTSVIITPEVTEIPVPEPPPTEPPRIIIWWPETLAPLNNEEAAAILAGHIADYERSVNGINVEIRLKQAQDVGGIIETLRTASVVAPDALPDLTLIQREDLVAAVQADLVQPLEGHISSAIIGNLHRAVLALGQVDDELYGLPYALEVQHLAYHPVTNNESWRFEEMLLRESPFVFPANRVNGVNDVFLVQYLAAGGALLDGGIINADALRDTLAFYEQAVAAGIVDPVVLDYSAPANYRRELASGTISAAVVTSSVYLEMLAEGQMLDYGLIPTSNGQPATVLNGWMWVVTTPAADRQTPAVAFLDWMLDAERQGEYDEAVYLLPSQRSALRRWINPAYARFVERLLDNATLPLADNETGSTARALQNGLTSVLLGARTADEATQDVLDQLES